MYKKRVGSMIALTAALLFTAGTKGYAHDGWVQVPSPHALTGEPVWIELLFGNHSNDHANYRIDGTWNLDNSSVYVVDQTGEFNDITASHFYMGELEESSNAGVNNYYMTSFQPEEAGLYPILVQGDSIFSGGDTASRTLRSAKSFVHVHDAGGDTAHDHEHDALDPSQAFTTDRAEFIPLTSPDQIIAGESASFELQLLGEPLPDTDVSIIQRSNAEAERITTDESGEFTFDVSEADHYLLRAMIVEEEDGDEYDQLQYETTLTFAASNERYEPSHEAAEAETAPEEQVETVEDTADEAAVLSNPFFYSMLFLGAGALAGGILFMRRKVV